MGSFVRQVDLTRKCLLLKHIGHNDYTFPVSIKLFKRSYASLKKLTRNVQHADLESTDEEFRVLVIPGYTELPDSDVSSKRPRRKEAPPARYKSMVPEQDWTNVWPAAQTFKWSAVPFPVRQGFIKGTENEGIPPGKYANAELMKIPNFLHLTPGHIKKHCKALQEFCTEWPAELSTDEDCQGHFPVEVITQDYIFDGPSLRDARARTVILKVKLSSLGLDHHAKDKMIRLAQHRYDPKTDLLTVMTDRCPLKKQNSDYAHYLLTALYHESWKTEPWEAEKTVADMEKFDWKVMGSKNVIVNLVRSQLQAANSNKNGSLPSHLTQLSAESSEEDITNLLAVQTYRDAVSSLHNDGEDLHSLDSYKDATKKLLLKTL